MTNASKNVLVTVVQAASVIMNEKAIEHTHPKVKKS